MKILDDGLELLSGRDVEPLLEAVAAQRGWQLKNWALDQIEHEPAHFTTAIYVVSVVIDQCVREVLIGITYRRPDLNDQDLQAMVFVRDGLRVCAWVYPNDPDLAGLPQITYPDRTLKLFRECGLISPTTTVNEVSQRMVTYRPRRRSVVRVQVGQRAWYAKALKSKRARPLAERHELLGATGVPSAQISALTDDDVLILDALEGRPLAKLIFDEQAPLEAESIIDLLDSLPPAVADFPRQPSWASSVESYAEQVATHLPESCARLEHLVQLIVSGLDRKPGCEPCHGDFHEGQLYVERGRVTGLLDLDRIGPGRRVDDLACLLAHLSSIQRMNQAQHGKVSALISSWTPVFDERVDPTQLRLSAAAVAISLASEPFCRQRKGWVKETNQILDVAESLIRSAG